MTETTKEMVTARRRILIIGSLNFFRVLFPEWFPYRGSHLVCAEFLAELSDRDVCRPESPVILIISLKDNILIKS